MNCHNCFKLSGNNFTVIKSYHLKFEANDLKGVQVMKKINLLCKSSFHMYSNVQIKLKVFVYIEYA